MKVVAFWFRRDLRLEDNHGLYQAMSSGLPVIPIFIFDEAILDSLPKDDPRVQFIHQELEKIHDSLDEQGSGLIIKKGNPLEVWTKLTQEYSIESVFTNHDYEPYALDRDKEVGAFLESKGISFLTFKDLVIFEKDEVTKDDGKPYTVYTPYKRKWLASLSGDSFSSFLSEDLSKFDAHRSTIPSLQEMGFKPSKIKVKPYSFDGLSNYEETRNFPALDSTSYLSPHLRFGTVSVRKLCRMAEETNQTFLSELIWREFFMQILYHYPQVVGQSFRPVYDNIQWENNEEHFQKWCNGETGYPMVDAGMRELNETGYMHNRVRMVVASFLTKHLLIDWRWGEAYFAEKLLDFELSSNNGNWQWAAGTGCDAAPYFRVFNPTEQLKKFDPEMKYVKKWLGSNLGKYLPIVDHKFARERALQRYKQGLGR